MNGMDGMDGMDPGGDETETETRCECRHRPPLGANATLNVATFKSPNSHKIAPIGAWMSMLQLSLIEYNSVAAYCLVFWTFFGVAHMCLKVPFELSASRTHSE